MARFDSGITHDSTAHYDEAPVPATPALTKPHKPKKMNDYIPRSYGNLSNWLSIQQNNLTAPLAAEMGMTTAERDAYLATVSTLATLAGEIVDLMEQLEQKTADFEPVLREKVGLLRAAIKRAKTSIRCTPGVREQLKWDGDEENFDPNTARPTITAEAQRGRIKIDGRKPGFEAVNIYSRKKGDVQWKLIAMRKSRFPYYDAAPLTLPGTPEVREYQALGVIEDEEIGQPSEIHEVVYAG